MSGSRSPRTPSPGTPSPDGPSPEEAGYSRPTSVSEMDTRMADQISPEGLQAAQDYRAAPSDVFVVTPPKCGTTWMQQIVHGLRTRGSMDFDNINDVVPWLQLAHDTGRDLNASQGARPHAFKTHNPLGDVPAGGRYIVVVRDPRDALLSHYRFFEGAFFEAGSIDVETFATEFYLPRARVHQHVLAAWPRRDDPDVLMLCYENIKADLPGAVARVARFVDIPLDADLLETVVRQSDIRFMQQHGSKFDDLAVFEAMRHRMRMPPTDSMSKVVDGHVGASASRVPESTKQQLAAAWTADVTPSTGLTSYEALRQELAT
jgi:hypothetical protein